MTDFKHVEEQIAGLRRLEPASDRYYMHDVVVNTADTMQALLDVARAVERDMYSYNLPRTVQDALAKLQEQDDD